MLFRKKKKTHTFYNLLDMKLSLIVNLSCIFLFWLLMEPGGFSQVHWPFVISVSWNALLCVFRSLLIDFRVCVHSYVYTYLLDPLTLRTPAMLTLWRRGRKEKEEMREEEGKRKVSIWLLIIMLWLIENLPGFWSELHWIYRPIWRDSESL